MTKRLLDLAVVLALALGSVLFVSFHVAGYTKLSPIDEMQHIDYLARVPEAPALADKVGQVAMRAQACRSVDSVGIQSPKCGLTSYDSDAFQERGYNTAALNPPVYYLATRAAAEVINAVTPADDLVTGARLAGGLWLGLGLVITYLVARRRGATVAAAGAVCALLLAAPAMLYGSATINPDAVAFLCGAILLALLTWWESSPSWKRGAVLAAAAGLTAGVKFTFLIAPAAIGAYLLLRLLQRHLDRRREAAEADVDTETATEPTAGRGLPSLKATLTTAFATVGVPLIVAFGWLQVQGARPQQDASDPPTMALAFHVPSFPWLMLYDNALVFVTPLSSPLVIVGTPQLATFVTSLVTIVLLGGLFAAAFCGAGPRSSQLLARAGLVAAIVFSIGLMTLNYVQMSSYFPLPARYGAALAPLFAIVTATSLRSRTGRATMVGVASLALVVSAFRVAGFA